MAEDKLYNQDLANLLIEKHGVDKNEAEAFIREFFLLIEEALEKDKVVKIKGLGTFKLVDVKSRESINVNTGERFEIQGHTKVSFSPDATLRDIINKPFAHFETVVLKENVKFDDEELISEPAYQESDDEDINEVTEVIKVVEKTEEPKEIVPEIPDYIVVTPLPEDMPELPQTTDDQPEIVVETQLVDQAEGPDVEVTEPEIKEEEELKSEPVEPEIIEEEPETIIKVEEPAEEIQVIGEPQEVILSDEIAVTDIEEEKAEEIIEEEVIATEEAVPVLAEDNPVTEEPEEIITPAPISKNERLPLEEIIARELQASNRFFHKAIDAEVTVKTEKISKHDESGPLEEPEEPEKPAVVKPATSNRPSKMFMVVTVIAAVVICSAAVLFTYFPTFMDDLFGYKKDRTEVAQNAEITPQPVPVVEDSLEAIRARNTVDSLLEATKRRESNAASTTAKPATPTAAPVVKTPPPAQNRVVSKPAVTPVPKTVETTIVQDNTPVRPDSTSYTIIGTKTQYTIQAGETLTRVSLRFYGTKDLWPYLVMHNRSKIPNPNVVPSGTTISIPELQKK